MMAATEISSFLLFRKEERKISNRLGVEEFRRNCTEFHWLQQDCWEAIITPRMTVRRPLPCNWCKEEDPASQREGSFCVNGPMLFRASPFHLRNMRGGSHLDFKEYEPFLQNVADHEPISTGYTTPQRKAESNNLCHMIHVCNRWTLLIIMIIMCFEGYPSTTLDLYFINILK